LICSGGTLTGKSRRAKRAVVDLGSDLSLDILESVDEGEWKPSSSVLNRDTPLLLLEGSREKASTNSSSASELEWR
jgi:hypothetical protein